MTGLSQFVHRISFGQAAQGVAPDKCSRALPPRLANLRDAFASWLVSLGAPLPWVSKALGHSDWSITARHYAKWMEDAESGPVVGQLDEGELWPDLLARVRPASDPVSPPNAILAATDPHR